MNQFRSKNNQNSFPTSSLDVEIVEVKDWNDLD